MCWLRGRDAMLAVRRRRAEVLASEKVICVSSLIQGNLLPPSQRQLQIWLFEEVVKKSLCHIFRLAARSSILCIIGEWNQSLYPFQLDPRVVALF